MFTLEGSRSIQSVKETKQIIVIERKHSNHSITSKKKLKEK